MSNDSLNGMIKMLSDVVQLDTETIDTVLASINSSKGFKNIHWFKHRLELPFMKTVNTFILTKHVEPVNSLLIDIFRDMSPDDEGYDELYEELSALTSDRSFSMAFYLKDWDLFDVPVREELNIYPFFTEQSAHDWIRKEWINQLEDDAINSIELPEL